MSRAGIRAPAGGGRDDAAPAPEGLRVRAARPSDLSAVVAVEQASFTTPWSGPTFTALFQRRSVLFRVLEGPDGRLLGHGILWWVGDEGELANLAVTPDARGRGGGRLLLDALLAEGMARGVRRVLLEVRESNEPALRIYRARGFRQVGVRRDYYTNPREDARVLALELPDP